MKGVDRKFTGVESIQGIMRNLATFEEHTCIKPVRIFEENVYKFDLEGIPTVPIQWNTNITRPCAAGVGRQNSFGLQMRPDCYLRGGETQTQHEFMHVLGFWHEQQRGDRDNYVKVHESLLNNPSYLKVGKDSKLRSIDLQQWDDTLDSPYDLDSIMQYVSFEFDDANSMNILVVGNARSNLIPQRTMWPFSEQEWLLNDSSKKKRRKSRFLIIYFLKKAEASPGHQTNQ